MATKCHFQDSGFCKYDRKCRFKHSEEVCRKPTCRNTSCPKRHPRPCRNFFLQKQCRFGQDCQYDHFFSCEVCDNLKFLIKKEIKKTKEINETTARMAEELSEARKEILGLKKEKNSLVKEIKSFKNELLKKEVEGRELEAYKDVLRQENHKNRLAVKAAEAEMKDVKKALAICQVNNRNIKDENERLVEMVDELKVDNQSVKSGKCVIENELKDVEKELTKFHNMENKYKETHDDNQKLRATLENVKESLEESERETFHEQIKLKDDEIKNLNITRKLIADNEIKLRRINLQLEKEVKDLKSQSIGSSKQSQLPYPCDKCESTFKTAGLLIRHVKSEHQNLPVTRP